MASNDVVGALYYKVVLDPKGFAKGASVIKSEQDLITRALKATTSDYDRLQAELEAVGERAAKAGAVERAVLEKYKKQIISDMEDIIKLEKERADEAAKQKVLAEEKKVLNAMQESLDKAKERKKIQKQLADEQVREARRVAKEKLAAEKERVRQEKSLEKSLAEFRKKRHGRRFQDLSRYFQSFPRFLVGLRRLGDLVGNVNGGLSKMAGNLAQAAGMSPQIQGLARAFGAMGIKVLAIGGALSAAFKVLKKSISVYQEYRRNLIRLEPLLDGNREKTKQLLEQMLDLSIQTGFSSSTMNDLAQSLLNVGAAVGSVKEIGLTLAGLAGGSEERLKLIVKAYSDVMMKGRLMGQEALQFANSSVPIYKALADSLDKPVSVIREMSEAGNITAEMVTEALLRFGEARDITGQIEKNMQSSAGQMARISGMMRKSMLGPGGSGETVLAFLLKGFGDLLERIDKLQNMEILKKGTWDDLISSFKDLNVVAGLFLDPLGFSVQLLREATGLIKTVGSDPAFNEAAQKASEKTDEEIDKLVKADELFKEQVKKYDELNSEIDDRLKSEQELYNQSIDRLVAEQKITEQQAEQLKNRNAELAALEEFKQKQREIIEEQRRQAEEDARRKADQAKRGMQGAVSGAGPSFGAGSTGEFKFLRDMILNKRQRDAEMKIQKEQKATLDSIDRNTKDQLEKLDELKPGGPIQPSVAIGGP